MQNGFLDPFPRFFGHQGHFPGLVTDQKIPEGSFFFCGNTMDNRKIFFLKFIFPNLAG